MLLRNMHNLYEADSTLGTTPPPTPDTSQDKTEDKGEETVTLTTKELSRISAKEAKDARAKAEKAFLEALGVKDLDEIKSILTSQREKQEAEKSETQKLLDQLNLAKQETAAAQVKLAEAEKTRRLAIRDSELKALLSKAYEPNEVLILLKASYAEKLDALLDEDGNFDSESATKLVSEYQTNKPHLFKDTSLGSNFSTRDGKAPQANEEAKKAIANMTAKSLKGF